MVGASVQNEATFETRVVDEVRRLFPALQQVKVTVQHTLTLRLGHHVVLVDGKESERVHGRLDVLVLVAEKPALLLELKRPGLKLSDSDRDQVISYARLLDPMPPLCVLSNGTDTRIFRTIDKNLWTAGTVDQASIAELVQEGLHAAVADIDDAVERLLGNEPGMWRSLAAAFNQNNLNELSGTIMDLTRPLVSGFSIPREVVKDIIGSLNAGKKFVAVVGPPLSGKTNVLAQVAEQCITAGVTPLYLDADDAETGVFQTLANLFSQRLFRSRDSNDVRQWLQISLKGAASASLVLLVDGWNATEGSQATESLHELLRICENTQVSVVLGVDDATWTRIAYRRGRSEPTRIGRKAVRVEVPLLSDREAESVQRLAFNLGCAFHDGWTHNVDYRSPGLIRLTLADAANHAFKTAKEKTGIAGDELAIAQKELLSASDELSRSCLLLPPITTIPLLEEVESRYLTVPELRADYREFADAVIGEILLRPSPELALYCYRRAIVRRTVARERLGDRLAALTRADHLRVADGPGEPVVVATVPEMVSAAAIDVLRERVAQHHRQGAIEVAVKEMLDCAAGLPAGEVVAACCLCRLPAEALTSFINSLMEMRPERHHLPAGSRALAQFDGTQIDLHFDEEMAAGGSGVENAWPALILSHIAGYLATGESGSLNTDINFQIWWNIGSLDNVLVPVPGDKILKLYMHEFEGGGAGLCANEGLIEPVTWSMQCAFHTGINDMRRLAKAAIEDDRFFLVMRLHHAARVASSATEVDTSKRAQEVLSMLDGYIQTRLNNMFHGAGREQAAR